MQGLFLSQSLKKRLAIFFFCGFLFITAPKPVYAWDAIPAELLGQTIDKLWIAIQGILKGLAKRLAVELAIRKANDLTGMGHKNSPTFITDYKNYLFAAVLDESLIAFDDVLTQTLGGKGSALVYTAATGGLQSLGRNYMNYLYSEGRSAIAEPYCRYTLDQYTSDPIRSLQDGDWRVFNAMVANSCNNPSGFAAQVRRQFEADLQRRAEAARTQAIANQGFLGPQKNGQLTAPGILIKELTANVQAIPSQMIGQANEWTEILSAAAGAFANTVMTNLFQKGFESVAKKIDRELGKVDSKVLEARRDIEKELGPGAYFFRNAVQHLGGSGTTGGQRGTITFPTSGTTGVCGTGSGPC